MEAVDAHLLDPREFGDPAALHSEGARAAFGDYVCTLVWGMKDPEAAEGEAAEEIRATAEILGQTLAKRGKRRAQGYANIRGVLKAIRDKQRTAAEHPASLSTAGASSAQPIPAAAARPVRLKSAAAAAAAAVPAKHPPPVPEEPEPDAPHVKRAKGTVAQATMAPPAGPPQPKIPFGAAYGRFPARGSVAEAMPAEESDTASEVVTLTAATGAAERPKAKAPAPPPPSGPYPYPVDDPMACWHCGRSGHFARDCPAWRPPRPDRSRSGGGRGGDGGRRDDQWRPSLRGSRYYGSSHDR